ncbi:MAG TPA: hypothetical protein VFO41_07260 [Alphaproteobacteria bacterium]|nr:hypothetical protein [Alphaproteobacteria bacterium]
MMDTATMTLDQLRHRLRRARAAIGGRGRFSVTFHQLDRQPERGECSILHWSDKNGAEECREIGYGTPADCLAALDRYVESHRRSRETAG